MKPDTSTRSTHQRRSDTLPIRGFEGFFTCEPTAAGTRVVHRECFSIHPAVAWLLEPLARLWLSRDTPAEVVRIKALLESLASSRGRSDHPLCRPCLSTTDDAAMRSGDAPGECIDRRKPPEAKDARMRSNQLVTILVVVVLVLLLIYLARAVF